MDEILNFIDKFKFIHKRELEEVFLYGNCYYFAIILKHRFPRVQIYYSYSVDHFVVRYKNHLYDISGDVTDKYPLNTLTRWSSLSKDEREFIQRDDICFQSR